MGVHSGSVATRRPGGLCSGGLLLCVATLKTLFEPGAYQEILGRVESLQPSAPRQWGKMSPAQMLEHLARALEMAAGKTPGEQALLGKLIGWAFWGGFLGPKPFPKNSPTAPSFIVPHEPNFAATKARVVGLLGELQALGEPGCDGKVHLFFGRLTGAEWGATQYKHLDHHLRQFGA
jgi:hypothetical protein